MDRKRYTLEGDLIPIIHGDVELPNNEEVTDVGNWLNNLASVGHGWQSIWGYSKIGNVSQWTMFFLQGAGMGSPPSCYDGGGYAVRYNGYPKLGKIGGQIYRFAICKHESIDDPGANHSRGWHPGHCAKCGMDMTIDSGD